MRSAERAIGQVDESLVVGADAKSSRALRSRPHPPFEKIEKCVGSILAGMEDIFKIVIVLSNPHDYKKMNARLAKQFEKARSSASIIPPPIRYGEILVELGGGCAGSAGNPGRLGAALILGGFGMLLAFLKV